MKPSGRCWILCATLAGLVACRTPPNVHARPLSVGVSLESISYARLTFEATNPSREDCQVARYVVAWPGHRHEEEPASLFVIPARGSVQRTIALRQGSYGASSSDFSISEIVCR